MKLLAVLIEMALVVAGRCRRRVLAAGNIGSAVSQNAGGRLGISVCGSE